MLRAQRQHEDRGKEHRQRSCGFQRDRLVQKDASQDRRRDDHSAQRERHGQGDADHAERELEAGIAADLGEKPDGDDRRQACPVRETSAGRSRSAPRRREPGPPQSARPSSPKPRTGRSAPPTAERCSPRCSTPPTTVQRTFPPDEDRAACRGGAGSGGGTFTGLILATGRLCAEGEDGRMQKEGQRDGGEYYISLSLRHSVSPSCFHARNVLHRNCRPPRRWPAQETNRKIVFAESCTGGLVSGALTKIPGISQCHCGGVVVYRNETKQAYLGISACCAEGSWTSQR